MGLLNTLQDGGDGGEVTRLPELFSDLLGGGLGADFVGAVIASALIATLMLTNAGLVVWAKRKITAAFTDRIAVNRVGPYGLLIIVADAVRLLSKELIVPEGADRPAYDLGPLLVVFSALLGFAVIPMGSIAGVEIQIADPEVGLVFVFAIASIASVGLVMGGYASNNKYSLIGGLRAVAQNIAYEIPLIVIAASVALYAGSLQMSEIVTVQNSTLIELGPIGIPAWFGLVNPFAFALFMIANLAEIGRNPFDTPEAPTEIVAGYQTEYSSVYFVLIYMGEFVHIFLGAAIITTVFLGGPAAPILIDGAENPLGLGLLWFLVKIWGVFFFTQWARAAFPRVRIDQLIEIGWKGLLVMSFVNLLLTAIIVGVIPQ
jgi:NADH-quinone oxidoreductase subunit H